MIPEIEKGKLLFVEREKIYKRNILFGKVLFYSFILLPIFLTIFYVLSTGKITKYFVLIWIISFVVEIIIFSRMAFAKRLTIYENGFIPPRLPIFLFLLRKNIFIKYDAITDVIIPRNSPEKIPILTVHTKDGLMFTMERTHVDENAMNKLVEILREKNPGVVKEARRSY